MAKADKATKSGLRSSRMISGRDLTTINVIRKHITTGRPVPGSRMELTLRPQESGSRPLRTAPPPAVIVGGLLSYEGFSLKSPEAISSPLRFVDADLAMCLSRERFDSYWDRFSSTLAYRSPSAEDQTNHPAFLRELFKGWLWPRRLPPGRQSADAQKWAEFEDLLGRQQFNGYRSVGAGLYRAGNALKVCYKSNPSRRLKLHQALLRSA